MVAYILSYGAASRRYTNSVRVVEPRAVCNLPAKASYFFSVKAQDAEGRLSTFSEEVGFYSAGPFDGSHGNYLGLFYEADHVRQESSGALELSLTVRGSYSGQICSGSVSWPFTGQFDLDGRATNVIKRPSNKPITLKLQLRGSAADQRLYGRLDAGDWVARLTADRAVFNSSNNPAPWFGRYTLLFPGLSEDAAQPLGNGYGMVYLTRAGQITVSGALADATHYDQTTSVSKQGFWPFYLPLYAGKGSLLAWLNFTNLPADDFNGLLNWIKPSHPTNRFYPAGFTTQLKVTGSKYVTPALPSERLLNFTNALMSCSGGNLPVPFKNAIRLGLSNQVANLSPNPLSLTFYPALGFFMGTVVPPSGGAALAFGGVAVQKQNIAAGLLLGTNRSSRVLISP